MIKTHKARVVPFTNRRRLPPAADAPVLAPELSPPRRSTRAAAHDVTARAARNAATARSRHQPRLYHLLIELQEIDPAIWRRVQIPAAASLRNLHDVIQAAMGWTNSHLHEFEIGARSFGRRDPEVDPPRDLLSDRTSTLADVASDPGARFTYDYDFGDGWTHEITIEAIVFAGVADRRALCVDGARACPPEDCGGPHGYVRLLSAIADPANEEHEELSDWIGGSFDAEQFDLDAANRRLRKIRL